MRSIAGRTHSIEVKEDDQLDLINQRHFNKLKSYFKATTTQTQNNDLISSKQAIRLESVYRFNNEPNKIIYDNLSSRRTKVEFDTNNKHLIYENKDIYDDSQASSPKTLILRARDFESSRNQLQFKHFSMPDKNNIERNGEHAEQENKALRTTYTTNKSNEIHANRFPSSKKSPKISKNHQSRQRIKNMKRTKISQTLFDFQNIPESHFLVTRTQIVQDTINRLLNPS